jgi:hypothetical protein
MNRVLRLDPLGARRLLPRRVRQHLYDYMLRRERPLDDPRSEAITTDDFELRSADLAECMDVVAICRTPLR